MSKQPIRRLRSVVSKASIISLCSRSRDGDPLGKLHSVVVHDHVLSVDVHAAFPVKQDPAVKYF
jgi:hypothetical protein